ncbi:MAG: sulfite exporter TauE/SafE family protein [Acidimicrobiia bacterium]
MVLLFLVAFAGFAASLVDGVLGMGFGPTSSTILLSAGLAPAAVSTTVNLAKVATGAASGAAHWRMGNIDRRLVLQLAGPGCIGSVVGVTILANVDGDQVRPYLAVMLLVVGVRILVRFSRAPSPSSGPAAGGPEPIGGPDFNRRGIGAAALVGGVTNGLIGAWGPVVTPVLLHRDGLEPRIAIGSANTAEVAVALVASGSLLASLGRAGVNGGEFLALMIGGVIAAPIAAWAVRHMASRALGVGAGGLLLLTNVRELSNWTGLGTTRWVAYTVAVVLCASAALWPRRGTFLRRPAVAGGSSAGAL